MSWFMFVVSLEAVRDAGNYSGTLEKMLWVPVNFKLLKQCSAVDYARETVCSRMYSELCGRASCNLAVDFAVQDVWCLGEHCSELAASFLNNETLSCFGSFEIPFMALLLGASCLLAIEVFLERGFPVLDSCIRAVLWLSRKTSHTASWSPGKPPLAPAAWKLNSLVPLHQNQQVIYTWMPEDVTRCLDLCEHTLS